MTTLLYVGLTNAVVATVLAALALLGSLLCHRPALRHGLWLLVLLKLVTPPLLPLHVLPLPVAAVEPFPAPDLSPAEVTGTNVELDQPGQTPNAADAPSTELNILAAAPEIQDSAEESAAGPAEVTDGPAWWRWPEAGISALLGLWLAGSITWLFLAASRAWRFHLLLGQAAPATPELQSQVRRLAEQLGIGSCPSIRLVPGHVSPMLWSMGGRPRLVLPSGLWEKLDARQQATLLVHELAHLRRRDHWVRGLELLVTVVFWWHPVVWWTRHELRRAEEDCCDAWVVWALPRSAKVYATALVETLDFLSQARALLPCEASGIGHTHDLKRRLTMIMCGTTPRGLGWRGLAAIVGLGALLLPVLPTWSQTPEIQRDIEKSVLRQLDQQSQAEGDRVRAEAIKLMSIQKAKAEVEQIQAQIAALTAQLRLAQERLKLQESAKTAWTFRNMPEGGEITINIRTSDGRTQTIRVPADGLRIGKEPPAAAPHSFPAPPAGAAGAAIRFVPVQPGVPAMTRPSPADRVGPTLPGTNRNQDVERRLDQLMKEIESIRRELKESHRSDARPIEPAAPGTNVRVPGVIRGRIENNERNYDSKSPGNAVPKPIEGQIIQRKPATPPPSVPSPLEPLPGGSGDSPGEPGPIKPLERR